MTTKKERAHTLKKFGFEFVSIFIAVTAAFALNNWNDNRKSANAERKILTEIYNGLEKDLNDVRLNQQGHEQGLEAALFFERLVAGNKIAQDSVLFHYLNLTRDFISIQNTTGYQTLKSRGLELIVNDQLRTEIISLYEYDFETMRKMEEEYDELQFQDQYFMEVNTILSPQFQLKDGAIAGLKSQLDIPENDCKKLMLYLWKMKVNRTFILTYYVQAISRIEEVQALLHAELYGKQGI